MTATETLAAAQEPHTGPTAYGPQTMARLAYNRLRRLGWQFETAPRVDAVLVLKPNGGKWHVTGDDFCRDWRRWWGFAPKMTMPKVPCRAARRTRRHGHRRQASQPQSSGSGCGTAPANARPATRRQASRTAKAAHYKRYAVGKRHGKTFAENIKERN